MPAPRCLLLPLTLVLLAALCAAQEQERIKICGRDLIRLAVSSCGNQRLRRSIMDEERAHQQTTSLWEQDVSTEEPPQSHEETDAIPVAPHWFPASSRFRRTAGKISDICCEKGCSMRELIQFC